MSGAGAEPSRTVLVTGGARRVGAVIARHLAARGWRVAIHHHRSADAARDLAATLPGAITVCGDLADPAATAALIGAARDRFEQTVCGLVNSAALFDHDAPPIADPAALDRHIAINLAAPALLASALAGQPDLEHGAVVNILDQKLANLNPDYFSYSCAKVALGGATVMLAQALGPRIRVNAVSPGLTLPSGDQSEAEFRAVASENLLRRPIEPVRIAEAVAFLLTARGISGQNVFVDNGQRFLPRDRDVMFATRC